ncbi:MAG: phospholipase D family protein [Candidatus Korarchaeum sp.]|nr:phospholipase D family protein [Candidatus Korarchaeum sp.]MDW8035838.1 phospholipase D family protein [Candidatus Korarchaeum sp.]
MNKLSVSLLLLIFLAMLLIVNSNMPRSPETQVSSQYRRAEVLFCPEDGCGESLISLFDKANETIDIAVYSFTNPEIADALVRAKGRGVKVRVILESEQVTSYSQYGKLKSAGIEVVLDRNEYLMHNKFAIIDGKVVATGSFNYTVAADKRNDENLVILLDERVAEEFRAEFEEMWSGIYGR